MEEKLYHDSEKLKDLVEAQESRRYLTITNFELFRKLYHAILNQNPNMVEIKAMNTEDFTYFINNYEEIASKWDELEQADKNNLLTLVANTTNKQNIINMKIQFNAFIRSIKRILDYYHKNEIGDREFLNKRAEFLTYIGAALLLEQ